MSNREKNDTAEKQDHSQPSETVNNIEDKGLEEDTKTSESMKDEIAELLKPIAIHEAKSAIYKAKLAGYVLKKGAQGAHKTSKFIHKKATEYMNERKKKK